MDEILKVGVNEMAGMAFDCSCGERHFVDIDKIAIGENMMGQILETVSDNKGKRLMLVADNNTYEVYGREVEENLKKEGFSFKTFVYHTVNALVPDEKSAGRLLFEVENETDFIVAVGSGVINDLAKIVSARTGIPYIICATAPSMDGYASVVAPFIIDGVKTTLLATYPKAIIGDVNIMKDAPMEMLRAGFGDMLGKITALADWELARKVKNDRYCSTTVTLVKNALDKIFSNVDGLLKRDKKAVGYVMEGLVLSGIAIGLYGDSRPASGGEHNFSHYWDMDFIAKGLEHPLHGNSVAAGTIVTAYAYQLIKDELPEGIECPDPEDLIRKLEAVGSTYSPKEIGISRELFIESMYKALDLKPRYTVFHYIRELGRLDEIARILTEKFYG